MTIRKYPALTEQQLRRSIYTALLLTILLPPFLGGSIMGLMGFYPMPEFYLVFTNYRALVYLGATLLVSFALVPRAARYVVGLTQMDHAIAQTSAARIFSRLPWLLLGTVTLYSVGGALIADFTFEDMGIREYSPREHLYNQFGLIPVVLITVFPIFFYFIDRLGRYLGPRGISVTAIPMWVKLLMLGIVTPLLIDSLLIGYFLNRTGYFEWETLALWFSLVMLAAGGTWLVWRSLRQGMAPLETFIASHSGSISERASASLTPLSLDEFGVLTARYAELLTAKQQLTSDLLRTQTLANSVIDNAGALVLVLDRDGRIVRFNHACEKLSGFTFAELEGQYPWATLLPLEDAETIHKEAFEALAHNPQTLSGQYTNYWVSKTGQRHLIDWSNTLLLDAEGKVEFMVSVGTDITERRHAEEQLRNSEMRLNEAQRVARMGSWELDLVTNHLIWSDEVFNLFEVDKSRFADTYEAFLNAIHPEDRNRVNEAYTRSLTNRTSYEVIHRLKMDDGRIKWVHERGDTTFDADGRPLRSVGTVQDITDLHQAQSALETFKHTLDRTLDAVFMFDPVTLQFTYVNQGALEQTGYMRDELLALHPYDIKPEYPAPRFREMVAPLLSGKQDMLRFETLHRAKDGKDVPVEIFMQFVAPVGESPRFVAISHDITERRRAHNRLRLMNENLELLVKERTAELAEREQQLARAQEISHLGHWTLNVSTGVVAWSDEIYRIFGREPQAFAPTRNRFFETVPPDDRVLLEDAESRAYAAGVPMSIDHRIVLPDQNIRWVHEEAVAEIDANGQPLRLTGTVQDITERKLAEAEVLRAKEEAERASRAKSDFLSSMSHELRTPMNAILGFAQVLQMADVAPEQQGHVKEILTAGWHLLELINELLDLSRIESGRLSIALEPLSPGRIADETIALVQPLAQQYGLTLRQRQNGCDGQAVLADPTRLKQVLVNLLSNAIKYNRPQGTVLLGCHVVSDGMLRVSVTDTGLGIPFEMQSRLFQPFDRLGAESSGIDGTGIGLALSKRLVELMSGRIGMDSTPGEGSTFWVDLPLAEMPAEVLAATLTDPKAHVPGLSGRKILYIEDNPANLRLVQQLLAKRTEFTLLDTHSGELGVELAIAHQPELILLDINLPGINGFEVLRQLRENPATQNIPVIAITADAMPRDIERGRAAGFNDYLTKPLDVVHLLAIIDQSLPRSLEN